ncbi:uroporphyrinogen-III C-methyltransferase [Shewanella sp. NIFS-20-20]|uniref:uroporphyrinogen-III C-methyltransferase n=1 Tax=Shewanella sp. NIFS-20-20 TaxID=2853806 RepID=UPI001C465560|nr:uroporphyrinogen-III C-methyltransferase [Shewanella sp. NIFS-20-20]MBV7315857.1 uroporphyrinogen-III C-methyltransferase [Shewanella sp. NIFS-20-20]
MAQQDDIVTLAYAKAIPGLVSLVGAGPGDADLLTVKALKCLQQADCILYDALVSEDILALIPAATEQILVGKRAGCHSATQSEINQLLITKAFTRRHVVRLKGGDPFIFGRGGEECLSLKAAGVRYQVVPGITAASGAAAYAGIPLTHRALARSVSFITGHSLDDDALDWQEYRSAQMTLVIYMGVEKAAVIAQRLIAAGRSAQTAAAFVANASRANQSVHACSLADIAAGKISNIPTPALLIVGDVTQLASEITWFEGRNQGCTKSNQQVN